MAAVHRVGDLRTCGAVTVAASPKKVFVNGQMISATGDINSHGGGTLTGTHNVYVGGLMVVAMGDPGAPDPIQGHTVTNAASGSPTVWVGL